MCGRYALTATPEEIVAAFQLLDIEAFPPRYNIAPTQPILMLAQGGRLPSGSNLPVRIPLLVRWGLIPSWVKDPRSISLLFNARAETAAEKQSFRAAMRHRRTLVPASGFYEWRRSGGVKAQAFWVRPRRGGVIAFAGLMETYLAADGSEIDTGAIITAPANEALAGIHDRMPVVIQPRDFGRWLDCRDNEPAAVADLLRPAEPDFFEAIPVSDRVNKVANMGAELQERVAAAEATATARCAPAPAQLSLF